MAEQLTQIEIVVPGKPPVFAVTSPRCVIGRAPDSTLRIDNDSVSRAHAELYKDPFGRWWIRDLKSRNGTKVNGVRTAERMIGAADVIRLGEVTLRLRLGDKSSPTAVLQPDPHVPELDAVTIEEESEESLVPAILSSLLSLAEDLAATSDATARKQAVCELLISQFPGVASLFVRLPTTGDNLHILHGPCLCGKRDSEYHISRTLLRKAAQSGRCVMGTNTNRSSAAVSISVDSSSMLAAGIACPIDQSPEGVTCLYVAIRPDYATGPWLSAVSLAARHYREAETNWLAREEQARHAVVDHDLQRARTIQQRLVPPPGHHNGLEWDIYYEPCRWVGGDYADAITLRDGSVVLAVADVCGKGLQASLVSSGLHTLIRTACRSNLSLSEVMDLANDYTREYLPADSFVTMAAIRVGPTPGEISFCNAGHPPLAIVSPDGKVREVWQPDGPGYHLPLAIGCEPMTAGGLSLSPGELLAIYSDGLTDLSNDAGDALGTDGLLRMLAEAARACQHSTLAEIRDHLRNALTRYRGSQLPPDDQTLLLSRWA